MNSEYVRFSIVKTSHDLGPNISKTIGCSDVRFQRVTDRKWNMANRMVT